MQFVKKTHKPAKNQEDLPKPVSTAVKSETEMFQEIEEFLKTQVKASKANLYGTMAQLVI